MKRSTCEETATEEEGCRAAYISPMRRCEEGKKIYTHTPRRGSKERSFNNSSNKKAMKRKTVDKEPLKGLKECAMHWMQPL